MRKILTIIALALITTSCADNLRRNDATKSPYRVVLIEPSGAESKYHAESTYSSTSVYWGYMLNEITFYGGNGEFSIGDTVLISVNKY